MANKRCFGILATLCFSLFLAAIGVRPAPRVKSKDTIILRGSPLGGVKFEHKLHQTRANDRCEICHHPSKPERPEVVPQGACAKCHTKPAKPPVKTSLQGAFHNPQATAGTCIDCHKKENAKGKKAPVRCMDCHKKANV